MRAGGLRATLALSVALLSLPFVVLPLTSRSWTVGLGIAGAAVLIPSPALEARLLVAIACWGGELAALHARSRISSWSVAPLAALLLLACEVAASRERVPRRGLVEVRAGLALARELLTACAVAAVAASVAVAAAELPGRGGAASGVVGAGAAAFLLFTISRTARRDA
jgi:hypothetical protein